MARIDYEMSVWGQTSSYSGRAYCDINGKALPCSIQTRGHGKLSQGTGSVHSDDFLAGVFRIDVCGGRRAAATDNDITVIHYKIDGSEEVFQHIDFAPEKVKRFAEKFNLEADCYHCKCLDSHLQRASQE